MIVSVDAYCEMAYGPAFRASEKSVKSKRDTVSRMCRDGVLDAFKSGRRWLIRLEDESVRK